MVLWFDEPNFKENLEAIEMLHRGVKIKFRGFIDKISVETMGKSKLENNYPHAKASLIE